jgi:hypothetical protein
MEAYFVYPIEADEFFVCACGQTVSVSGVVIPEYSQRQSCPTCSAEWHLLTGPELDAVNVLPAREAPAIAIEVIVAHEPVSLHHLYLYKDASLQDAAVEVRFKLAERGGIA